MCGYCSGAQYTLPAHKVSDHIGVTDDDIICVLLFIDVSSVKVPSEGCFNPGPFLIEFLDDKICSNRTYS